MSLYLISIGLQDEKDLSLRAIETARECDILYVEFYTTMLNTNVTRLSEILGKSVTEVKRKDLEDDAGKILEEAKTKKVGILVGGDCLTATTHISLLADAKKQGIPIKVIHGSSIYTAVCETGLFIYKFGKTATIPLNGKMDNVKKTIRGNRKVGLHTLLLLDLDSELNLYMNVFHALKMLLKERLVKKDERIIAARIGDSEIYYKTVSELMRKKLSVPSVLIIPGKLHFREKEFLESL